MKKQNYKRLILCGLFLFAFIAPKKSVAKRNVPVIIHKCSKNDSTEDMLSCAIYHESRGDGERGMLLVGNVIMNRKNHEQYPAKLKKVLYQRYQFSYTQRKSLVITEKESWEKAKTISKVLIFLDKNPEARRLIDSRLLQKDVLYFFNSKSVPLWAKKNLKLAFKYKNHVFYEEKS